VDVAHLTAEERMRPDLYLDQCVAGRLAGTSLAAQAQGLAALQAGRNTDVEAPALRQGQALAGAPHRVEEGHQKGGSSVGALPPLRVGAAPRPEDAGQDVAQVIVIGTEPGAVAHPCSAFGVVAVGPLTWRRPRERVRGRAFLARRIDLPAIEAGPSLGVRQQVVRRVGLLETLLRLRVSGMQVGMRGLGKLEERGPDLLLPCRDLPP